MTRKKHRILYILKSIYKLSYRFSQLARRFMFRC